MAHTMDDAFEEWELIQASINQDYFSLDPISHTSLGEAQLSTTINIPPVLDHYREPEQLRHNHLSLPNSEHESSETGDAVASEQEKNSVGEKATGGEKPWPVVWWKFQLDNLSKCFGVFGMSHKPFWCVSVAATMISFVVLRKKIFGMKHKQRAAIVSGKVCVKFVCQQFVLCF
jgi:hypothetical protein